VTGLLRPLTSARSLILYVLWPQSYLEIFRELNKLYFNFVATPYDNFERSYLQKYDFDLLTSSDLDLKSRSLKIQSIGSWIMSENYKFDKDLFCSF